MSKVKFSKAGNVNSWSWLMLQLGRPRYDFELIKSTVAKFATGLRDNGVRSSQPVDGRVVPMQYPTDPILDQLFKEASDKFGALLIVLPEDNTELYNYIKTLGDTKYGLHTVCVVGTKFINQKGQDMYFANVAHKFNLKFGGHNQIVEQERLSFIKEDKTMIVGIDVTHPSPGSSSGAPSVASMVASIDRHLGQWPGVLGIQEKSRQEMVSNLKDMLKSRLKNWKTLGKHNAFPENIIVYRDGVSEGQYSTVLAEEEPQLRQACKETYPPEDTKRGLPHISIIIVGKRHHTRFYPTSLDNADRNGNCKPGTVVDRGVTEEGAWDCFLQSHAVIKGTGRPAHYYVILDEIFRGRALRDKKPNPHAANELEKVTQAMCYIYGRATKAVSICTPAYYADILCERSRRYLSDVFDGTSDEASTVAGSVMGGGDTGGRITIHDKLKDTMFYI